MRLQKFLSDAGVASRRHAEELILEGHVLVNNEVIAELPAFVDPTNDTVLVDGAVVRIQRLRYYLVHKPPGVVCTNSDPSGRPRAIDLLPPLKQRLFPVGRLDEDSSGLLLMTNDGELAELVTHPRFGVPKVYRAEARGRVARDLPERMKQGVYLSEGKARAADVEIVRTTEKSSILNITLREGRNRQVRRMLAKLGHPVRKLKRLQIGPLSLKGLPVGAARELTARELEMLREALAEAVRAQAARRRQTRPGKPRTRTSTAPKAKAAGKPSPTARPSGRTRGPGRKPEPPTLKRRIVG
jgi:23S rRNA pseudouridine2605 synthase